MRTGHLSLRGQPLNVPLLDVFKKDELTLQLSCGSEKISTTKFVEIKTEVTNHLGESGPLASSPSEKRIANMSERTTRLEITLEPLTTPFWAATDSRHRPSAQGLKNLLIDGRLSRIIPSFPSGGHETHTVSMVFLAKGIYSFRAVAREVAKVPGSEGLIRFSSTLTVNVD